MTQQSPQAARPAPPRRKKGGRRRSQRGGISPFAIMAVIAVIFIAALIAVQQLSTANQTRNLREEGRTLVKEGASPAVTIYEFSDFQ